MLLHGVDDDRVLERIGVAQLTGQAHVDDAGVTDLDADQAARPGDVEQASDLETAELELLGDLDLGSTVQVVPTRHRCDEDQLRRPGEKLSARDPRSYEHRRHIVPVPLDDAVVRPRNFAFETIGAHLSTCREVIVVLSTRELDPWPQP